MIRLDGTDFDLHRPSRHATGRRGAARSAAARHGWPAGPAFAVASGDPTQGAGATATTREKLLKEASRKQKVLDPRSLIAAEFMILSTSLPAESYPATDVLAVYRLRWQIELAFKRLKSLLRMDRLPTRTDRASRSWLTAHLILALLCDDLSQEFLNSSP